MGTAIFSLKIHFLLTFLVVVLEKVKVKIKFLSHLLIARIPPFLIPNLYNYAQCFRSSNKRNYQPKEVGKLAKWIQIVLEWVVHELQYMVSDSVRLSFTREITAGPGPQL